MRRVGVALAVLLLVGAAPAQGTATGLWRAALVTDGAHVLDGREGHLLVLGGRVTVPADAGLDGALVLVDGAVALEGTVAGDVFHLGGTLALGDAAHVGGRLVAAGGTLQRAPGARVDGGLVRDLAAAGALVRPPPTLGERLVRGALQVAALALLAWSLARWASRPVARTADALAQHPVVALAMGALAGLVGLVLLAAMASTVVLIPVALVGAVAFGFAVAYGWVAWGAWLARRVRARDAVSPAATALGTAAFVVAQALVALVPVVGGALALLASVAALGAVLLTGFGVRRFVPDGARPRGG